METFFIVIVVGLLIFFLFSVIRNNEQIGAFEKKIKNLEGRIKQLEKNGPAKSNEPIFKEYQKFEEVAKTEIPPKVQEVQTPIEPPKFKISPVPPVTEVPPKIQELKQNELIEKVEPKNEGSEKPDVIEQLTEEKAEGKNTVEELIGRVEAEMNKQEDPIEEKPAAKPPVFHGVKREVEDIGYAYSRIVNTNPIPVAKKPSEFWAKTEKQFLENWTGILGAMIMVAGVVFFGVYAALKMTAMYRFLLITGFSVLLTTAFIYLKRHEKWIKLALWLRSSAGAVFLFGCLGSATVPGLQWVFDPVMGIIIIDIGIIVNLFLGFIGGDQVYASLHVLLSLVALSIVPPSELTLIMAALVTLFGVALTFREKWNYHLLLTITSFFAYHLYWFSQQSVITMPIKILGIITVVSISTTVALVHYRGVYKNKVFDALPFIVHLINWFYFGTGLFLYSSGMKVSTFFIAIGSIAAFFLARKARKLEITWLYYTDTLVAQATAIIALISLHNWNVNLPFILTAIFAEALLYLFIMKTEKQDFLYKVGMFVINVVGFVIIAVDFIPGMDNSNTLDYYGISDFKSFRNLYEISSELIFCFLAGTVFVIYTASQNKRFKELFVFFGIVLAGIFVMGNMFLFQTNNKMTTIYLGAGAIITFLLALRIRKADIKWLYYIDILLAQGMSVLALATLKNWEFDTTFIISSIFAEVLLFVGIVVRENDKLLYQIGGVFLYLISIILALVSLVQLNYSDMTLIYRHTGEIAGCLVLGILFVFYGYPKTKEFKDLFELFGLFIGAFFGILYLYLYHTQWVEYGAVFAGLIIIFIKEKSHLRELAYASLIIVLTVFAINWHYLITTYTSVRGVDTLMHGAPLFIMAGFSIKWSEYFGKFLTWIGIYLFAIHTVILSYLVFNPISSFIPGVIWIVLSPVALELSHFARKKTSNTAPYKNFTDRFLLHVGYVLILLFLIRHVLVHLQSEQYLGSFIKIRFSIEILALLIFMFWASSEKPEGAKYTSWEYLHPMFIELIIGFFVLTVSVESTVLWFPIIWISSAFVMAFIGNWKKETLSRLVFYALVMYWVTAIQVAFVTSNYVTPSNYWYDQASYSGSLSLVLQFIFLVYFYTKCSLAETQFPTPVSFFKSIANGVQKARNSWIFYPLIICTALFLFYSFDKSILTLLWVVECFAVFILSVILREKYFRYVALVGLGACIIRLIFFDLAQTSTLTRAFVFIGVGIIMLVMNSIYNKYKGRFGNE